MSQATFKIFRGDRNGGDLVEYKVPIAPGMVVLDALHYVQAHDAPDLAVRWNCKAGKCGSCSAEVNGRPRLTCKTRMDALPLDEPITVRPMKTFPIIKDLVTDVAWNYQVNRKIPPFTPRPNVEWKMYQQDIDRVQEFRKCIEWSLAFLLPAVRGCSCDSSHLNGGTSPPFRSPPEVRRAKQGRLTSSSWLL